MFKFYDELLRCKNLSIVEVFLFSYLTSINNEKNRIRFPEKEFIEDNLGLTYAQASKILRKLQDRTYLKIHYGEMINGCRKIIEMLIGSDLDYINNKN